jgi:hypothetical protein
MQQISYVAQQVVVKPRNANQWTTNSKETPAKRHQQAIRALLFNCGKGFAVQLLLVHLYLLLSSIDQSELYLVGAFCDYMFTSCISTFLNGSKGLSVQLCCSCCAFQFMSL